MVLELQRLHTVRREVGAAADVRLRSKEGEGSGLEALDAAVVAVHAGEVLEKGKEDPAARGCCRGLAGELRWLLVALAAVVLWWQRLEEEKEMEM